MDIRLLVYKFKQAILFFVRLMDNRNSVGMNKSPKNYANPIHLLHYICIDVSEYDFSSR